MKKIAIYFISLALIFSLSCAGSRTIVNQVTDASFLIFYGKKSMSTDNFGYFVENTYEAKIDDVVTFNIELSKKRKDSFLSKVYQVTPGKHTIKVIKNGELIINKVIFISNQETMQFELF